MKKIKVKSAEEYFNLPKKERTECGMYLAPQSLPCNFLDINDSEWDKFESGIKKEFPVQWLFRIKFPDLFSGIIYTTKDLKSNIKNFINPNHPRFRKAYKRHEFKDLDSSIPAVLFALLLDFWYGEVYPESIVDWGQDWETRDYNEDWIVKDEIKEKHKQMMKEQFEIYKWIEQTVKDIEEKLPALEKELDEKNNVWFRDRNGEVTLDDIQDLEKKLFDEETRIMKEIIDHRSYLWT